MSKAEQLWNATVPLTTSEVQSSVEVDLADTVGTVRIICQPAGAAAATHDYKVVVYLQNDQGLWEPQSYEDDAHGSASSGDWTSTVDRKVHNIPNQLPTIGFDVSTFGYKKLKVGVWGTASDTVQIFALKRNRRGA